MSNKREYYRIEYPHGDQPIFLHYLGKFTVLDVSEGGFSFAFDKIMPPMEGEVVEGDIKFGNRGKTKIKGEIIRVADGKVSVRLHDDGQIPLPRVMEEQRYLIQKYPR
ncbi:MAG: PilZ domain-containing protein [Oligoflexus sp.]